MWTNYALAFWRSLARRPLYGALNVAGLAVGVATFLVLFLVVRYETSFDRWVPDAANVYRITQVWAFPGRPVERSANSTGVALPLLQADYPQILAGARTLPDVLPMRVGDRLDSQQVEYVDPSFFDVFQLPFLAGQPRNALRPGGAVLTEKVARAYFGKTAVLGRTFTVSRDGKPHAYQVTGVIADPPRNSSVDIDLLLPLTPAEMGSTNAFSKWGGASGETYLRFRNPADAAAVAGDLDRFVDRRADHDMLGPKPSRYLRLEMTALPDLHFADIRLRGHGAARAADPRVVASLGVVGVLTLLIAVLNYVNLASAQSVLRAREVAVRKVLGATRRALVAQFMAESLGLALAAALLGLALTELALPAVNALNGSALRLTYLSDGVLPLLAGLVLVVGLGAGLYPALLISRYEPAAVLASAKAPGGGRRGAQVRSALVLIQFAAAIAFAIGTVVVGAQTAYVRHVDPGYRREGLILVQSTEDPALATRLGVLREALAATPGVVAVAYSDREPRSDNRSTVNVGRPGMDLNKLPMLLRETVGDGYFETYGVRPLAGRVFQPGRADDDLACVYDDGPPGRQVSVVLNAAATKALGFASPQAAVGQPLILPGLQKGQTRPVVIGVVPDVRFESPREAVDPQFYIHDSRCIRNAVAAVRYQGADVPTMLGRLRASWRRLAPDYPFEAQTADVRLDSYFQPDERRARLFGLGAFVAVALGCVGLFGLAAFTTARRTKEIGIRKALGASTADVLRLLVGQFLRPVLLANLIAWPLSFLALRAWLAGFDQRIALSPGYFLLVALGAVALAVGTVADQAFRVARTEPARALRYE